MRQAWNSQVDRRFRLGDAPILAALRELARSSRQTNRPTRSLDFVLALKRTGGKARELVVNHLFLSSLPIETSLAKVGCPASVSKYDF
jgi:hypothetical protein